ncbi:hypothetical protein DZC72_13215 [Maribacter algicola]|uniref:Uncharacterized protein n=1 Tax=Maribacter algicola TaxID=2498892 RepID=A0A426RHZ4_9FLAO|nr:hypothetical protein [Maribacter algicola]RRQ48641.1 hypothetical protein DZC72_13215 [Maribacter algicola]
MNINWNISQTDIEKVKKVIIDNENALLRARRLRNVEKRNIVIEKDIVIKTMLMCLLTSQQRSGPNSKVGQFLKLDPLPITSEILEVTRNIEKFLKDTLVQNSLTRYVNRISFFFASNYKKIVESNWAIVGDLEILKISDSKISERKVADNFAKYFDGFGPKQSRNFLQALGLTKYEIPIDSRITTWLNDFGFPIMLTSSPLGNNGYYHFVSDGIQKLCEKAEIYPCLLDAAIFSSFDNNEWTEENIIF